jgi:alpha-glucosidase (family GH31 glycosyl hydrolase)
MLERNATSSWTGDNIATWEHLWIANIQMQRMSISGMGFTGSDIGGFAEQPRGIVCALDSIGFFILL